MSFECFQGLFPSSLADDYHPITTLTQVLFSNYKPVTKLIFSYHRRAQSSMQESAWIWSYVLHIVHQIDML